MKTKWLALTMVAMVVSLVACDAGVGGPPATIPFVDVTSDTALVASIPPTVTPDVSVTLTGVSIDTSDGLPPAVENLRLQYAVQRGLDPSSILVEGLEGVVWDSTCLGVAPEGVVCQPGSVAGYRFALVEGGGRYVYHSDESGRIAHLVEAPPMDVGEVLMTWEEVDIICQRIVIGVGGLAYGECGLPLVRSQMANNPQEGDLGLFLTTYAPFEADTAAGRVVFSGRGVTVATPAEQRMIAEWTKFTRDVVWSGRAGAAWGLVITWVSEPDCANVNILITGVAYATRCDTHYVDRDLGQMRLDPAQLETLYRYHDTYQAFEWTGVAAGSSISMQVASRGSQWPSPEQQAEISNFVRELLFQFPSQGYEFPEP